MQKRLLPILLLIGYGAFLANLLVFKINFLRVGSLMIRFAQDPAPPNFMPFKTIGPYLLGEPNRLIAALNVGGNIALFVPVGFLVSLILPRMTWLGSLAVGAAASLAIEGTQAALGVGVFDIDDVILNALGVVVGHWAFALLVGARRPAR